MKNSEAVMIVENALRDAGVSVLRVGGIDTGEFQQGHHPEIAEGAYKVIEVTVVVRDDDSPSQPSRGGVNAC